MAIDKRIKKGGIKEMKAYRFLLVFLMLIISVAFAADAMAASVTINHAGGTLNGTLSSLSVNSDGNVAVTVIENLTGSSGGGGGTSDTQAPSVPSGLNAAAASSSQINLTWNASTDNVGVAGYKIYRGGSQIATTSSSSYSNTGLLASTQYCYNVAAYDSAGNTSSQSSQACATTSVVTGGGTSGATKLNPMPEQYTDSVSPNSPKKYYFTLSSGVSRVIVQMASTDWTGNADMIASKTSQPSCSSIVGNSSYGTNGNYFNITQDSNETIYIRESFPADTMFYVTICGNGDYKVFWNAY